MSGESNVWSVPTKREGGGEREGGAGKKFLTVSETITKANQMALKPIFSVVPWAGRVQAEPLQPRDG